MLTRNPVFGLVASITGNVTDQAMVRQYRSLHFGGAGIEAGGRIVLGTATSVDVTVKDQNGKVLYTATGITANVTIDPIAAAIQGPLLVTTANISNAAHTLSVYWGVRK